MAKDKATKGKGDDVMTTQTDEEKAAAAAAAEAEKNNAEGTDAEGNPPEAPEGNDDAIGTDDGDADAAGTDGDAAAAGDAPTVGDTADNQRDAPEGVHAAPDNNEEDKAEAADLGEAGRGDRDMGMVIVGAIRYFAGIKLSQSELAEFKNAFPDLYTF